MDGGRGRLIGGVLRRVLVTGELDSVVAGFGRLVFG